MVPPALVPADWIDDKKNSTIQGLWAGQKILFQDLKWKIPNDGACYEEVIPNQSPTQASVPWEEEKYILKKQHRRKWRSIDRNRDTETEGRKEKES